MVGLLYCQSGIVNKRVTDVRLTCTSTVSMGAVACFDRGPLTGFYIGPGLAIFEQVDALSFIVLMPCWLLLLGHGWLVGK